MEALRQSFADEFAGGAEPAVVPADVAAWLALEACPPEVLVLDAKGHVVAVNEAWRASVAELETPPLPDGVGASYVELIGQLVTPERAQALKRDIEALIGGRTSQVEYAYAAPTVHGERWRQAQITALRQGREPRYLAVHHDLTPRVQAQAALVSVSDQLATARRDARRRLGVVLHDATRTHLASLRLGLARLTQLTQDDRGLALIEEMRTSLREAVLETRDLSAAAPAGLESDGLAVTARAFVRSFARRIGIRATFRATGLVDDASPAVRHAAFRIMQEALSNVHRHARATCVRVKIAADLDGVVLEVADNGVGLGRAATAAPGVGLYSMRSRAERLGGVLEIIGGGKGTVVRAAMPLG